ncbi:Uncharacterized protein conserved in archaea [Archaeoglobus sulfaticallidus PM70-1]|uniref:UPF0179 protein Asulf_00871 n=1 Tax=Archaeoglobus sulfaticallidus PM70-1 TaxID=387631 RepID=N0BCY8_9EURY|nr:UPF0179 family protein [Archaeoglobus sulfaticallidus]AGK60878.1 Uncharacterized protein conserved in archaea [Archaeoglobus sulfaticallidus PM70-1]
MDEVNKIITLCGRTWANIGVEFTFIGGRDECEKCRLKRPCLRLKENAKYKIVSLRDGTVQECPLHDGGVVAVEVVELPIIALLESKKSVEGAKIRYEKKHCEIFNCSMYNLCHPAELMDGEEVVVEKIIGDSPGVCEKGLSVKVVELARANQN